MAQPPPAVIGRRADSLFPKSVQQPGHDPVTVNAIDQRNNSSTQTQRSSSNSDTVNTPKNLLGQTSVQAGAGLLPATFNCDTGSGTTNTGQLTSLTTYKSATFSSNTITGTGAATTKWAYDPATGMLTSKTYADGTSDQYQYNGKFQLANLVEPGITGSSFAYDNARLLISGSLTDAVTGKVSMQIGHVDPASGKWVSGYDEMGRPKAVIDTDNGHSYTTVFTVDNLQRPVKTIFGSAGNASVNYDYAPATNFTSTESPGAPRTMTLSSGSGSNLAGTSYTYEIDAKRLKTIAVNGVTFTFNYFPGSNQIQSVVAMPSSGGSGVTTTYVRDTSDLARLTRVGVGGAQGLVFTDTVDSYNQQDQINSRTVNRRDANDDGTLANAVATAYGYTYDAGKGDALTNVTVNGGAAPGYSYGYDQVGNFTGNSTLGSSNNVNQYGGLSYNGREDVIDDGTYAYQYDTNDRLITVTPHDTGRAQLRFGYDSQGRRLWKTAYTNVGGAWTLSYTATTSGTATTLWPSWTAPTPATYVVVQDLSGNVQALVDPASGNTVASFHYDPYGNPLSSSGRQNLLRTKCWVHLPNTSGGVSTWRFRGGVERREVIR